MPLKKLEYAGNVDEEAKDNTSYFNLYTNKKLGLGQDIQDASKTIGNYSIFTNEVIKSHASDTVDVEFYKNGALAFTKANITLARSTTLSTLFGSSPHLVIPENNTLNC